MNRFYYKFGFTLTAFCFLISLNLKAQDASFTPAHLKAAEEMLSSMDMPTAFSSTINNMIKAQSANVPLDKQKAFSDTMQAFMNKYLTWDLLKTDMAKIYASEFSEQEIKELTKFYQTPLGKKMIEKSPVMMQKGMLIGQKAVMAHQAELQEMIKAAVTKN